MGSQLAPSWLAELMAEEKPVKRKALKIALWIVRTGTWAEFVMSP